MRKVTIKIKKEVNLVLGIETKNSHQALLDTQLKITFLKVKKTDSTRGCYFQVRNNPIEARKEMPINTNPFESL